MHLLDKVLTDVITARLKSELLYDMKGARGGDNEIEEIVGHR